MHDIDALHGWREKENLIVCKFCLNNIILLLMLENSADLFYSLLQMYNSKGKRSVFFMEQDSNRKYSLIYQPEQFIQHYKIHKYNSVLKY